MGKNIGAAVAIHLYHEKCAGTARKKGAMSDVAAGIVLQTPFTSICGVAKGKVPRNHDLFDSRRKIERINCPTFFVHGLLDEVITTKHSRVRLPSLPFFCCDEEKRKKKKKTWE